MSVSFQFVLQVVQIEVSMPVHNPRCEAEEYMWLAMLREHAAPHPAGIFGTLLHMMAGQQL
jgi:hypothetical protein